MLPFSPSPAFPCTWQVALRDAYYNLIAIIDVADVYEPSKDDEAKLVYGTGDRAHPGVAYLFNEAGKYYVGGTVRGFQLPPHFDFKDYRMTPREVRRSFQTLGWYKTLAFHTDDALTHSEIALARTLADDLGAFLLIQPAVGGPALANDVSYPVRVRCYKAVMEEADQYFDPNAVTLNLAPLATRRAGPREALWHAIIRKNYGASHFVVGRDHAGGLDPFGAPFYDPYAAQELVASYAEEIGITPVAAPRMVYALEARRFLPKDAVDGEYKEQSNSDLVDMLRRGQDVPRWFVPPAVVDVLHTEFPPLRTRGFVLFFTGFSGSGTVALTHFKGGRGLLVY